ncbi:TonB-dependent receptor [Teredinibacter sp. KSP-S5-2]|uniref:TonB-dependent receptor n=1 Tax=Teredinibacter sp. KSP-S5-2 TaxID=3034506 RepID=UPI0029346DA8|nr:TonB-dependent receptor [Teredinibacter sp. KSP-S5-2]WNO08560.1 TonB-dependent receptor [Teredinibacter sp. KSP-S5-2]
MSVQFKRRLLGLAVSAAAASMATSFAYAQEEAVNNGVIDEEVIVYGLRGSIMSSQDLKREASTVKDVITASDIGALPDKSVTEALQRIPGVTMDRFSSAEDPNHFSSEGSGVIVRGLQRVRSEINGRDAFSAGAYGGGLGYSDIPAELLGSVEVVKNQTADLIAGGVAGTVNLVTRKPFDSDEQVIFASLKGTYGDHREEWTPVITGMFSNVWEGDAGKIGFLFGATDSEFKDRGDGAGIDNYYERSAEANETDYFAPGGTEIPGYEGQKLYAPSGTTIRSSDSIRERKGIVTSLQWADPSEKVELTLEHIYSDASLEWDERVIWAGTRGYEVDPAEVIVVDSQFDSDGFMTGGELYTTWLNAQTRWRKTDTDIKDTSLHIKIKPEDALTLDFDVQRIESKNNVVDYSLSSQMRPVNSWHANGTYAPTNVEYDRSVFNAVTSTTFQLSGSDISSIGYPDATVNPAFPEQAFIYSSMDKEENIEANSTAFTFDLTYEFEGSWFSEFKTGVYLSDKTQTAKDSDWNWGEVSAPWAGWWDPDTTDADNPWGTWWELPFEGSYLYHPEYFEAYTFSANDFHGGGLLNGDQSFLFPRMDMVRGFSDTLRQFEQDMPYSNTATDLSGRDNVVDGKYLQSEITETNEDRMELYLQGSFSFDDVRFPVKGNFGARYISWQVSSTGAILFPVAFGWDEASNQSIGDYVAANFPDENAFANSAETEPATVKGDKYTKVLPSFNLSVSWTDDFITRLAISENVYMPIFRNFRNYQKLSKSVEYDNSQSGPGVVNSISFSGEAGNPYIEPEEALSMDVTAEWYFADAGSLTVSLFRKELDNIIRQRLYNQKVVNPESGVEQTVAFQQDINTDGGDISGIEMAYSQFFDFLPGALSGLGVSANYTYIDQSGINDKQGFGEGSGGEGGRNSFRTFTDLGLPGYSDDNFNFALMYEKYDISARLAYSWRSEYLLTRRDADHFAPVYATDTGQLDASLAYNINDNFKVGLEASNITDEVITTELQLNQEGHRTIRNQFKTDRRFGVYVQAKF